RSDTWAIECTMSPSSTPFAPGRDREHSTAAVADPARQCRRRRRLPATGAAVAARPPPSSPTPARAAPGEHGAPRPLPPGRLPARRDGEGWEIDVAQARDRMALPERRDRAPPRRERTVCICHDVERGLGHVDVDRAFARRADQTSPRDLESMRKIESELEVRA